MALKIPSQLQRRESSLNFQNTRYVGGSVYSRLKGPPPPFSHFPLLLVVCAFDVIYGIEGAMQVEQMQGESIVG